MGVHLETGCVLEMGGAGEGEEDPWMEVRSRRVEGVSWGGRSCEDEEEEELRQEGNEAGTSSLGEEEEEPTLERDREEVYTGDVWRGDDYNTTDGCHYSLGIMGGPPGPLGG